jgi:hypothetical protein
VNQTRKRHARLHSPTLIYQTSKLHRMRPSTPFVEHHHITVVTLPYCHPIIIISPPLCHHFTTILPPFYHHFTTILPLTDAKGSTGLSRANG